MSSENKNDEQLQQQQQQQGFDNNNTLQGQQGSITSFQGLQIPKISEDKSAQLAKELINSHNSEVFCTIKLQKGVTKWNLLTYYFGAIWSIGLIICVNTLQPFLFTNFFKINPLKQGSAAGNAAFAGELVMIPGLFIAGVISDRIGRKLVNCAGFFIAGIGFFIAPHLKTYDEYVAVRCFMALGYAAVTGMLATILGDYVEDESRGKATGVMGMCNAVGAAFSALVLSKLPEYFSNMGIKSDDGKAQGIASYSLVGGLHLLVCLILYFGLAGREVEKPSEEIVPVVKCLVQGVSAARKDKYLLIAYITAFVARADLAMAGVFIPQWSASYQLETAKRNAIADSAIFCNPLAANKNMTTSHPFVAKAVSGNPYNPSLFFNATLETKVCSQSELYHPVNDKILYQGFYSYYNQSQFCCNKVTDSQCSNATRITNSTRMIEECKFGFSCCTCKPGGDWQKCNITREYEVELSSFGISSAGSLIAILGGGGILSAPVFGIIADRWNRVRVIALALTVNIVGYGLSIFVVDPTSAIAFFMALVIGLGEVAGVISTQTLIQERAEELNEPGTKGSIIGFFNLCGGLGILINSKIGGELFEHWRYAGPFIWLSLLNVAIGGMCYVMAFPYAKKRAEEIAKHSEKLPMAVSKSPEA